MNPEKRSSSQSKSSIRKITVIGLITNIFLFLVKLLLGIFGRSQALTADAFHSLSDFTTDFSIIFGVKYWSKPPDENHPYGHGRIETVVTVFICAVLVMAALSLGYHAVISLKGEQGESPEFIAFIGAALSIILKEVLYRWTSKIGKKEKSKALTANAWHHRTDALSSIPVAVAILISVINEKWAFLDQVTALLVSLFILYAAYKILKSVLFEIMATGVSEKDKTEIKSIVQSIKGVKSMHKIRSRQMGSDWFIDLHIQVDGNMTVNKGHEIAESVKKALIEKGPDIIDVMVHIEPYEK
jgi:cation diffusion facilitator family transporter